MNQEQNGCQAADNTLADAVSQFADGTVLEVDRHTIARLARAGRRLIHELERVNDRLTDAQHKADDQPRTIVLSWMPNRYEDRPEHPDHPRDTGGYWTVSEHGRHQWGLDPREAMALVAAMLLGAPYPAMRSCMEQEHQGYARGKRESEGKLSVTDTVTVGKGA